MIVVLAGLFLFLCLCGAPPNITTCCEYLESLKEGGLNDTRFAGCLGPTWVTQRRSDFVQWPTSPPCNLLTSPIYGHCERRLSNDTAMCGTVGKPCFYCECGVFAPTSGCDSPCNGTTGMDIAWYVLFVFAALVGLLGIIGLWRLKSDTNSHHYTDIRL